MTPQQKELIRRDLAKCNTPGEIFEYLQKTFDLSKPLGSIAKPLFVDGIMKGILMLNPNLKK